MIKNFVLTFLILLLGLGVTYVAVFELDPFGEQKTIAYMAFIIGSFSAISAFCTFFFFFLLELFTGHTAGTKAYGEAMRRGILVGIFFAGMILMQLLNILNLLELTLWALLLALIEFIQISK